MKTLKELISNRIFRIPDYQRGYSWEKKHIQELMNDIENIRIQAQKCYHFTGIISYSEYLIDEFKAKEDCNIIEGIEVYHITDGQQRLTTLFIILFECYKKYLNDDQFLSEFINKVLKIKIGNDFVYRFGYDVDVPSREFLYSEIFEDRTYNVTKPATLYTNNLLAAKKFVREYLEAFYQDSKRLKRLIRKLEGKLLFQEFVIDTNKLDVALVFETMNYRGKNLSKLELFKNRLFYLLTNKDFDNEQMSFLKQKITDTWLTVYSWLGKISDIKISDDSFLRAFIIIHFENSDTIRGEFKNIIERLFLIEFPIRSDDDNTNLQFNNICKLLDNMVLISKSYFILNNPYSEDEEIHQLEIPENIRRSLYILIQVKGADYINILICSALGNYLNSQNRNTTELIELFEEIEKHQMILFNFLGRKINANREKIFRECNNVFEEKISYSTLKNRIFSFTDDWWSKPNSDLFFLNNIDSNVDRFYDLDWVKLLIFLKEVESEKIPITKIGEFKQDLIFPNEWGSNKKFPNVVRSRTPQSIHILRFSLGNIHLIEKKILNKISTNDPNKVNDRIEIFNQSQVLKNHEISIKLDNWSDQNILERGFEIFNFITERYQIYLSEDSIKDILVDDLVIEKI